MSRAQFTVAISTDEEAAASKRMVIYAFSAQINLFPSFFHVYSGFYFKIKLGPRLCVRVISPLLRPSSCSIKIFIK